MKVLAGDIGGTKTNLGIFEVKHNRVESLLELSNINEQFDSLEEIIEKFLHYGVKNLGRESNVLQFHHACFGVAGPVRNNHSRMTNLPWVIDGKRIKQQFNWHSVNLLNDMEANAWGISALHDDDFIILNQGDTNQQSLQANASIISAGTGLGEAGLFWDGKQHIPFASEGSHADFSPTTDKEYRLYQFLHKKYQGHVSWERIVSGMGLENLYQFLTIDNNVATPDWLAKQMREGDTAAVISKAALEGKDKLCEQALDWLVYFYGMEAGNQALKIMSAGGVFLGGGIAPKIISYLQSKKFMQAFCNKGRMKNLLKAMPVKVIMNDKTALYGPAIYAHAMSKK